MKIIHSYITRSFLRTFALSLLGIVLLFLTADFFERIDNIIPEDASLLIVLQYFLLKVPLIVSLMLPVAVLAATLFTIGLLSKNSEITAMRASGLTIFWITKPLYILGACLSLGCILLNETVVPYATRRVKEIYNLDIQKKHNTGTYSQENFWFRNGNSFFSVGMFDSRSNTLHDLLRIDMSDNFTPLRRTDAERADFLTPILGWSMRKVSEYRFSSHIVEEAHNPGAEPLNISAKPQDFYDVRTDPHTMSHRQLRRFINKQTTNGLSTTQYLPDLYEKLASPFLLLIIIPVVLPFALKPARTGSLASSFLAALTIGFSYYAIHSLSLALGRAEIWPPLLAAWMANFIMAAVGLVLSLGAESP